MKKQQAKIGGQAVIEGVMMRGKQSMALAVRAEDGTVLVCSQRIKNHTKISKIPIIRGIVSFASSMTVGVSTLIKSADMATDGEEKLGKGAYAFSIFAAVVIALGIFFFLPSLFGDFFYSKVFSNLLLKNLASGLLRVILFVAYLFLTSLMKDMKRTFRYHGAEHKTINCYESGAELNVQNIKKCSCRHNRCGTTFLFLVMLISIIVFAFADYGLRALLPLKGYAATFAYMGIKLLLLPIVAGISYEVLFLLAKCGDNLFAKILRAPGLALQALTTAQPDEQMIEVALKSFLMVLKMENDPTIEEREYDKIPLSECFECAYEVLDQLNAERVEAEWMLCYVLKCSRSQLRAKTHLGLKGFKQFREILSKRRQMPLDYCLGLSCFCGYDIMVDKNVLIPRAETEILASKAVEIANELALKSVLDLCCGSGCVGMVVAKQTNASITAVDICDRALQVAQKNLSGLNVKIVQSDLFASLGQDKFDLIAANPPYIASDEIQSLQFEVQCQPRMALDGGSDGLNFYRRIAVESRAHLNKNGILLLEVGINQAQPVEQILKQNGFEGIEIINDLSGIERIVKAAF